MKGAWIIRVSCIKGGMTGLRDEWIWCGGACLKHEGFEA